MDTQSLYTTSLNLLSYICHQLPERTLTVDGRLLPLCARCTGIYIGFIVGFIYQFVRMRKVSELPSIGLCSLLAVSICILVVDGIGEKTHIWYLSNDIRYLIGLLCGSSFSVILLPLFNSFYRHYSTQLTITTTHYVSILMLLLLLYTDPFFVASYYIYSILSILGFIIIYSVVNLIFIGMVFHVTRKSINFMSIPNLLIGLSAVFIGEIILLVIAR
jgi:uncharacterized membrane protein